MKAYLAYKDSGIEWLGEIPAHWKVVLLKRLLKAIKDGTHGTFERFDKGKPLLSAKNVFPDGIRIDEGESLISEADFDEIVKNGFPCKGDVLLTIVGTIGRAFVYNLDYPLAFQRSVAFLRFKSSVNPYYYYYFSQTPYFVGNLYSSAKTSAQSGIYMRDVVQVPVIQLSIEEQRTIAAFLDHKTRQIDTYVAKKQQQIERLQAYRTALINQAVTKGLNPDAPMKDSGIEWLGEIPAHWETLQIKRILERNDYGISASLSGDGKFKVLTMGHIQNGEVILPDKGCVDNVPDELILEKNDLLFNRTNSWDLVGKVGIFRGNREDNISFASYLVRFRMNVKAFPVYIHYLLNSVLVLSKARSLALVSINQANLNPTKYGQIRICLPPLEEQKKIAAYLDQQTAKIDTLIAKTQHQIDRLQAYRTSLISDTVTGKIDVREAVCGIE